MKELIQTMTLVNIQNKQQNRLARGPQYMDLIGLFPFFKYESQMLQVACCT